MGPVFLGRIVAYTFGWAIIAAERYCQWPQKSQCFLTKTCYRCQRMGPLSCKNNLPMAKKGPSVSFKKCCQYACMGSLSSLNGPIVAFTKYYRSSQIGPVFLRRNDANALGWAYYCCWRISWRPQMHPVFLQVILPMPLKGPINAAENGCRWTAMNGPSVPTKKCCRYPWMGPSLLWRNAANGHEWAHVPTKKCCRSPWLGPLLLLNSPTDGPTGLIVSTTRSCWYTCWSIFVAEEYF